MNIPRGFGQCSSDYSGVEISVFLLNVFAKNEKIDLSVAERNVLRSVLNEMVEIYEKRN